MGNDISSQTKYSNKQFFGNNVNSIAVSTISQYLGEPCYNITNNSKNCSRSLKYVQDNKEKNCTKYCMNNFKLWINDLFVKYPKYVVYSTRQIKIKGIIYQFLSDRLKTEIYVENHRINLSIFENGKQIMNIKNISLEDLLNIFDIKKYNELTIQVIPIDSYILITSSYFIGFKDSRLFKPTKYWETGYNFPPTLTIDLKTGETIKGSTIKTDIYGYKRLESVNTVKEYVNNKLITNKFTSMF